MSHWGGAGGRKSAKIVSRIIWMTPKNGSHRPQIWLCTTWHICRISKSPLEDHSGCKRKNRFHFSPKICLTIWKIKLKKSYFSLPWPSNFIPDFSSKSYSHQYVFYCYFLEFQNILKKKISNIFLSCKNAKTLSFITIE